jgi:hypothetical protein
VSKAYPKVFVLTEMNLELIHRHRQRFPVKKEAESSSYQAFFAYLIHVYNDLWEAYFDAIVAEVELGDILKIAVTFGMLKPLAPWALNLFPVSSNPRAE